MINEIKTKEELQKLVNTSAYTITGAGGDLNEWINGYNKLLEKEQIGKPSSWYKFTGKLMNDAYDLSGDNRYPNDVTFLSFSLDNLNLGKLAIFKLRMGDRWLDDIVSNDVNREEEACNV